MRVLRNFFSKLQSNTTISLQELRKRREGYYKEKTKTRRKDRKERKKVEREVEGKYFWSMVARTWTEAHSV